MDKKKIIFAALIAALLVVSVYLVVNLGSPSQVKVNPAFRTYISAFTSGVISVESSIKIELANDFVDSSSFEKPIEKELFSFYPKISGTAYWIDTRTIEFRPDKPMSPNTIYTGKFYISEILSMPDSLETFVFQFRTSKQASEIEIQNHKAYNTKDLTRERVLGTLRTADVAELDNVKAGLKAEQDGKQLPLTVVASGDKRAFEFTVDSVKRGEKSSVVEVSFDGSEIGAQGTQSENVDIPSINDFVYTGVTVLSEPEQVVIIQFSDPLEQYQSLDGVVWIGSIEGMTYMIEDNEIRIYTAYEEIGDHELVVETTLKNAAGKNLKTAVKETITFEELKPNVKLVGNGVILPSSNGLIFPFDAVNLKAVDVTILRIYENNVPQFLQNNDMSGRRELSRVGKVILKKTILLSSATNAPVNFSVWNRYSIDLSEFIKAEPGAIYRVSISFNKSYALYDCLDDADEPEIVVSGWNEAESQEEDWDYYSDYDNYYYYNDYYYDWGTSDPCEDSYYYGKTFSRNVLATDIGLITKIGAGGIVQVFANNIVTTEPMSGVDLKFYDYQNQEIGRVVTDGGGMAEVKLSKAPHLLIAESGQQKAYMRLVGGASLSMSMFDVSGESVRKGIKGFIYGERGVWRPGDSIFISFILEDKLKRLPEETPVIFNLINPRGLKVSNMIKTKGVNGFYDFRTATDPDAPTGNYTAEITVGGAVFSKIIRVETIKPNRLKLKLDFGMDKIIPGKDTKGVLEARWLHGAIARNLKAIVSMRLVPMTTSFEKFKDYAFDDPSRRFYSDENIIFDGKLDENGRAEVSPDIDMRRNAPGVLKAYFETRVFEQGGEFSVDRFSLPYYPYKSYVGIDVPEGDHFDMVLETGKDHHFDIVNVDAEGNLQTGTKLKVDIYKVDWRWWWDNSGSDLADYVQSSYNLPYESKDLITVSGKAGFNFKVDDADWGRYFIRVVDVASGHSCGKVVYIDWPNWASRTRDGQEAVSMLIFSSDKDKYEVGDEVMLTIPSAEGGRALISIENGTKILKTAWVKTQAGQTTYSFPVTEEMSPNVYAFVTLLQPHNQTVNDLPIRLYGVIPILVENPGTHMEPVITMADVLRPESQASITISEKNNRAMTYTLAVVDEGLLDLTKFKTPDPWNYFYAREALGIRTWDVYDDVIGAYGGELDRILSLGGGDDGEAGPGKNRANRFKPMVKYFGPYELKVGQKATHTFMMPQYVGSVRVMVVAGQNGAYGNAEKTVAVKKPLMLLATLPRVVGPMEKVSLPVSVFAMEKNIKSATVKVVTNEFFSVDGPAVKTVNFSDIGDELVEFTLNVKPGTGVGKVKVTATSGNETATHEIEIDVRNPNPEVTQVVEALIKPGETWTGAYEPVGMTGTNEGILEVSSIPPLNLEKRMKELIRYPYGCLEQTVSSVFPQLFLADLMELDDNAKARVDKNILAGIRKLNSFQLGSGGMSYWPGDHYSDDWATSYAGHFLLEAQARGYAVSSSTLNKWKKHQRKRALAWNSDMNYYYNNSDLIQAYRLYTLALAKSPEIGAMNNLRGKKRLSTAAKWRLAAAYQLAGMTEVANALIADAKTDIKDYRETRHTYGSAERDQAMIIEALCLLNKQTEAAPIVKSLSAKMAKNEWMSTQTLSYSLIAIAKFVKNDGKASGLKFNYAFNNGQTQMKTSVKPVVNIDMGLKGSDRKGKVRIQNTSSSLMYVRLILHGIPAVGQEKTASNNLTLSVNYTNKKGDKIDVSKLEQGTDFIAEVEIGNPGLLGSYYNIALTAVFPSGWEIHNTRMDEYYGRVEMSTYDYIDFRDDRVNVFFGLQAKTKKSFRFLLNSSYLGKFYLPAIVVEGMYDNTIYARTEGKWVEITPYDYGKTSEK